MKNGIFQQKMVDGELRCNS